MGIGEGFRQIRDDYADVMVCGGVEAPLNQLCFGAFAIIGESTNAAEICAPNQNR